MTESLVRAYPIGVISMIDNGRNDEKIIAIPFNDPTYNHYTNIDQLPAHVFDEIKVQKTNKNCVKLPYQVYGGVSNAKLETPLFFILNL